MIAEVKGARLLDRQGCPLESGCRARCSCAESRAPLWRLRLHAVEDSLALRIYYNGLAIPFLNYHDPLAIPQHADSFTAIVGVRLSYLRTRYNHAIPFVYALS